MKESNPLAPTALLASLIVTVVGGIIVAIIVGEGRFAPVTPTLGAAQKDTYTSPTPTALTIAPPTLLPTITRIPPTSTPLPPTRVILTATITLNISQTILTVRAYIDGRSRLVLREDTAYWLHLNYVAPGRAEGNNYPTYFDSAEWYPTWKDSPDRLNRDCNCQSSTYFGIPALALQSQTIALSIVKAREKVAIIQQPNPSNQYTFIIEFDDYTTWYADWYEVKLTYISVRK